MQINRATVSITPNIAEENVRSSNKEKVYFIEIAYGSLMKVSCQLEISKELNFISQEDWKSIKVDMLRLAKMLPSLRKYYKLRP